MTDTPDIHQALPMEAKVTAPNGLSWGRLVSAGVSLRSPDNVHPASVLYTERFEEAAAGANIGTENTNANAKVLTLA